MTRPLATPMTATTTKEPTMTTLTETTITDAQIRDLSTEAVEAGDLAQVSLCEAALAGDQAARRKCDRVISDAAAQ